MKFCFYPLRRIIIFFVLLIAASSYADTAEYQLTAPENKTDITYNKDIYNEIGTLKITASEAFDKNKKVIVTINYDGKFTNSKNSEQIVNYNLVLGTSDSYKILIDGDKIEFSAASIDANIGITLGAVITGDAISDGDYKTEINFASVVFPVRGGGVHIWEI